MPLMHYAIRPGGFLFLGSSESVGRFDNVFSVIDQKARLFERLPGSPTYPIPLPGERRDVRRLASFFAIVLNDGRGQRQAGVAP